MIIIGSKQNNIYKYEKRLKVLMLEKKQLKLNYGGGGEWVGWAEEIFL
jgi:hypothetical protein